MMGRQNNDPTVLHSIALLQERFRKLERVKEMREEREFLRGFTQQQQQQQPKCFLHPDLVRPSRPLTGPRLDHSHGGRGDQSEFQAFNNSSLSMRLWPDRPANMQSSNNCCETDVDTSLHL